MEEFSAPRVNSKMLPMFCGKSVLLVGKVTTKSETEALLESSDLGQIKVLRNPVSSQLAFLRYRGVSP